MSVKFRSSFYRSSKTRVLSKTINSESTFTSDVDFKILDIAADDLTGALEIFVEPEENSLLEVERGRYLGTVR